MTNQELLQKMKEDMEMRGFSYWTKESYELKAKDTMRYFKKPMEEVTIEELRNYLLKYLKEERKLSERSGNKALELSRKDRKLPHMHVDSKSDDFAEPRKRSRGGIRGRLCRRLRSLVLTS